MEQSNTVIAPEEEAQLAPDFEEARQKVADYSERYLEYKTRYGRTLVKTKYGLQSGDQEVKAAWGIIENHMNELLDKLFEQNVILGINGLEPVGIAGDIEQKPVAKELTTVRFQLPNEPIPEFHDEYIVLIDDEDLGRGRKFEV